eukprot:gb/GFBE01049687.1/.p1 GENE.gb/GFBE01049687.1/~~gb/GFBE01049687.1/.p1  ORF type:complete len:163 (+),score=36.78 gb/GFBE01049687.1/:1-489(+)
MPSPGSRLFGMRGEGFVDARRPVAPDAGFPAAYPSTAGPSAGMPPVQNPSLVQDHAAAPGPPDTFSQLRDLEAQLRAAEAELFTTERALRAAQVSPGQAKADLAQLEARLEKIQCKGIDSVSTADLPAEDEEAARSFRRRLTREVERLQNFLDATFDYIKKM